MIQKRNRGYTTKFNNETYQFIKNLDKNMLINDIAEKLDVSYFNLYYTFKKNRITYNLSKKIEKEFILTDEQKKELKDLVVR